MIYFISNLMKDYLRYLLTKNWNKYTIYLMLILKIALNYYEIFIIIIIIIIITIIIIVIIVNKNQF